MAKYTAEELKRIREVQKANREILADIKKQEEVMKAHNETAKSYGQAQEKIKKLQEKIKDLNQEDLDVSQETLKNTDRQLGLENSLAMKMQKSKAIRAELGNMGQQAIIGAQNMASLEGTILALVETRADKELNLSEELVKQVDSATDLNEAQKTIGTTLFDNAELNKQLEEDLEGLERKRLDILAGRVDLTQKERDAMLQVLDTAIQRNKVQQDISKFQGMQNDAVTKLQGPMNDVKDKAMEMGAMLKAVFANPALALVAGLGLAAKQMFDLFKGAQSLKTELGISDEAAVGLQMQISEVSMSMKAAGVESADVAEAQMALINNFGGVAASSTDLLMNMAKLKADFGVSGQAAGALMVTMKAIGASSEQAAMEMAKNVASLAQAEGVAPGQVMQDIANNTEAFAGFAKDGGMNVAMAAIEAKKLGINFDTAVKIADNLLDFESSIQQQMEAEILLGRQLNLDKARQLALSGDIEGLQREVLKNVGSEADFNAMNVLQRRALAQSIGISVTELSKMVANQNNINKATETQKGMTDLLAMIMKEVRGLSEDLISIWMVLKPIFMVALAPIGLAVFAMVKLLGYTAQLITFVDDQLGGGLSVVLGTLTSIYLLSKLWAKEGLMASIKQYAQSLKTYLLEKKTAVMKKVSSGSGSGGSGGSGKGGSGLGFVEKLDPKKLMQGAAAMLIVSAALFVTAKALQEFTSVEFSDLVKAGVALLGLTLALVAIGAIMTSGVGAVAILAGAAAMLVIAAALLVLGHAIQAIGSGFSMLSEGLTSFTPLLTTLVPLASGIFILAGAFGALGMGMGALAIGALALLPALPVLLALAGIGMLGMALAGGGESDVAESEPMAVTDMSVTEEKLDGVISAVHALEATNRELLTTMNRGIKGLAEV